LEHWGNMQVLGGWKNWAKQARTWCEGAVRSYVERIGEGIVQEARRLAPVDTGFLRSTIDWAIVGEGISGMTLHVFVGATYGIFQEFGTRKMAPHPYMRPAINQAGSRFVSTEMVFAGPTGTGPMGGWHGLRADLRRGKERFRGPYGSRLSAKEKAHVKNVLLPSLKRYNRGLSGRAKFRVRRK
jgi:HK97 gp10 family phage protein